VLWAVVIAAAAAVVVGSVSEIHAQSGGYRDSIDTGYAALASRVVDASNQTGRQLASLIKEAPTLENTTFPNGTLRSARAELQQGLDQAVDDTEQQEAEAAHLVPPYPTGNVSTGLTSVMATRAGAVSRLRTAIDRQLGMSPLPVAGAPSTTTTTTTGAALSSLGEASSAMQAAGRLLEGADRDYRAVSSSARDQPAPMRLPRSVWVPPPADAAPLGAAGLAALASALHASAALPAFHQLVITAAGLSPPAVTSGSPGTVGTGCGLDARSTVAGPTPSLLPPTGTVTVYLTVTNCGTVTESEVTVSQRLALADPAGTALPPAAARGGSARLTVKAIRATSSTALVLPPMAVAAGHLYTLDLAIAIPAGQRLNADGAAGSSQGFLIQISP
jgi:hypothetical protein